MLQSLLGQSPLSTTGGIIGLVGLVMILLGLIFNKDEVWKAGIGIATAGSTLIGFVARDNRASVVAHQESLDLVAAAKQHASEKHEENAQAITTVIDTAQAVAAETAKAVVDEKLK